MQAPLKLDIQRFAGLLTITFTYTSTASGYESGSKNFIGVNNCSSLKS
jgi:hypothetical protein